MRLLLLSDIHADAAALERVLEHARDKEWTQVVFLGDIVGYGAQPVEAVDLLRSLPLRVALEGNHEVMMQMLRRGERVAATPDIVGRLQEHLEGLDSGHMEFIDSLAPDHAEDDWAAIHGALRQRFEYLISVPVARGNAEHMKRDIYFYGHTHVPIAFIEPEGGQWTARAFTGPEGSVSIPEGARAFLNPGSVSMSRDRLPSNSYGIYDSASRNFSVYRLPL